MPLRLFFSNSLDSLSEVLREILRLRSRASGSLFRGPSIVIPNPNVKRWLQLRLARRDGSCFDLGLGEMQDVLAGILNQLAGVENPHGLLSRSEFQLYVFRALCRCVEVVHKPEIDPEIIDGNRYSQDLKPILFYLYGSGHRTSHSERHLWQLSIKLAELFQEYYHHRYFELISRWDTWRQSRSMNIANEDALEIAQFRVYEMVQIIRARDRLVDGVEGKLMLSELAQMVLGDLRIESQTSLENDIPDLHIFGLSQIFDFHQLLLGRLAKSISIFVYTFNPCREFWEDVETPFEEYRRKLIQGKRATLISSRKRISKEENQKGAVDLPEESDIYVLRSWGRPGRENIRLLCELANYDVDWVPGLHIPESASQDSLLTRLQRQILTRSPREYPEKPSLDNSLRIFACPSLFREIENIRQLILKAVIDDPSLSLNEIAILVPSMETYKPVIEAVLARRPGEIPFNLVDSTAGEDSFYAQAIFVILEIMRLGATRPRLFRLFRNPCYYEQFDLDIDDIEILLDWFDELNALHEKPSASEAKIISGRSAPFGFHQALVRLRLGLIMESDSTLLGREMVAFKETMPSQLSEGDDGNLLEKISLTMELFEAAGKSLQARPDDLEWAVEVLEKLVNDLLVVPESMPAEERIRSMVQSRLQDIRSLAKHGFGVEKVEISTLLVLSFYLEEHLGSTPSSIGKYLGKGVTVAAMRPMRPLPFRMVFVPGLQEGGFPGHPDKSTLDLRTLKRKIGDANRMEKDCYLFLELVTSTREKLILSYLHRDLQKDEKYQTCQVLNQLIRCVESDVLSHSDKIPIHEIPLTGYHLNYFEKNSFHGMVNYEVADRITFLLKKGGLSSLCDLPDESHLKAFTKDLRPQVGLASKADFEHSEKIISITLKDLSSFLKEPGSAVLRKWHRLFSNPEYERDLAVKEVEPFRPDYEVNKHLQAEPILNLFKALRPAEEELNSELVQEQFEVELYRLGLEAKVPSEPYRTSLRRNSMEVLERRIANLRKYIPHLTAGDIKEIRFLEAEKSKLINLPGVVGYEAPEFKVELKKPWNGETPGIYKIKITGNLRSVYFTEEGSSIYFLRLINDKKPEKGFLNPNSLDAFLSLMILFSLRIFDRPGKREADYSKLNKIFILEVGTEQSNLHSFEFNPTDGYDLYLENLIKDFLEQHDPIFFPYKHFKKQVKSILAGETASHDWEGPESKKVPAIVRIANLELPKDPVDFVKRRYRLLNLQPTKGDGA